MKVRRSNEERSRSTRAQLLAAATSLFAEQGYTATSMAGVAAAAQLSTGALYHHWPTKESLLAAVVSSIHRRLSTVIAETVPVDAPARQQFGHAAVVFLRHCADRDVAQILLTDAPAVLGPVWDELDQRWWLGPAEELVHRAVDEGSLVAADPRLLAVALLGSLTALGRVVANSGDPRALGDAEQIMVMLAAALDSQVKPEC